MEIVAFQTIDATYWGRISFFLRIGQIPEILFGAHIQLSSDVAFSYIVFSLSPYILWPDNTTQNIRDEYTPSSFFFDVGAFSNRILRVLDGFHSNLDTYVMIEDMIYAK